MAISLPPAPAELLSAAYFPGPRSENESWTRGELQTVLDHWFGWRRDTARNDPGISSAKGFEALAQLERVRLGEGVRELSERLTAETPTHTPHYVGHMKAELSLPALLGWFAAMLHNPNYLNNLKTLAERAPDSKARLAMLRERFRAMAAK